MYANYAGVGKQWAAAECVVGVFAAFAWGTMRYVKLVERVSADYAARD